MSDTKIKVEHVKNWSDLYCHHPRQNGAQPVFVYLDCESGELWAHYRGSVGDTCSQSEWNNRTLRWAIPALPADDANDLLDEIAPIAETIINGFSTRYNGQNNVGEYTGEAQEAIDKIESLCQNSERSERILYGVGGNGEVECSDFWDGADLDVTAETTDTELEAIADQLIADGSDDNLAVFDRELIVRWLTGMRNDLRD